MVRPSFVIRDWSSSPLEQFPFFNPPPFNLHTLTTGEVSARWKSRKRRVLGQAKGTTHAIHWPLYWFAGVLKRALVMPLLKHTNLLDQVCQNIDWEEVRLAPLCSLQRGSHAMKQDYQRSRRQWKDVHHFLSANTKGRELGRDWDVEDERNGGYKKKERKKWNKQENTSCMQMIGLLMYSWPSCRVLITRHAWQSLKDRDFKYMSVMLKTNHFCCDANALLAEKWVNKEH